MKKIKKGLIQIYTGDGKGKTTAALGQTMRALGWGLKVCWIQFIKGYSNIGEVKFLRKISRIFPKKIVFKQFHKTKRISISMPAKIHKITSQKAWNFAKKIIKNDEFDLLILDELNNALDYNLINITDVLEVIADKPKGMELVITGRDANPKLIKIADLVTIMKKKKHPFDKGLIARKGIEY